MNQGDRQHRAASRLQRAEGFVGRQGEHPGVTRMSPDEALALIWPLSRDAWLLSGRELPVYTRDEMPGRVSRGGKAR